jgi:large subunit ribosomal protein L14e
MRTERPKLRVGSIIRITHGPHVNKLATVVDLVDSGRLLVDGPLTGVERNVLPLEQASLTGLEMSITRNARRKQLVKKWGECLIQERWDASAYAKALATRAAKANLPDFPGSPCDRSFVLRANGMKVYAPTPEQLASWECFCGDEGCDNGGGKRPTCWWFCEHPAHECDAEDIRNRMPVGVLFEFGFDRYACEPCIDKPHSCEAENCPANHFAGDECTNDDAENST